MIKIESELLKKYIFELKRRAIPEYKHSYYLKWLRFFLDYCHKYRLNTHHEQSLPSFYMKHKPGWRLQLTYRFCFTAQNLF